MKEYWKKQYNTNCDDMKTETDECVFLHSFNV